MWGVTCHVYDLGGNISFVLLSGKEIYQHTAKGPEDGLLPFLSWGKSTWYAFLLDVVCF